MSFELTAVLCISVLIGLVVFLVWNVRALRQVDPAAAVSGVVELHVNRLREDVDRLERGMREEIRGTRQENTTALDGIRAQLTTQLENVQVTTNNRLGEVRTTLEGRLKELQSENSAKLDQMRQTVDEKLQSTLQTRLDASFKQVSDRLEQVHRGLGEMQTLAVGVGDLKRVLGNVKTRGIFGEVQLAAILEEMLTPDQFSANVATRPGSNDRVEFAIRLPGRKDDESPVWIPVDAKFPREDYERLLDAQERADVEAAALAGAALERRLRDEAKSIALKYVSPPHTTDFAILFLPTEGLFAEALRRPGLVESLQREYRIMVTGPTTLSATLNSLRMGFRTLAIEKRSSEVWQVLGAVKTEFGKFGDVLAKTRKKLDEASNIIDSAGTRSRVIERKLKSVESASEDETLRLLGIGLDAGKDEGIEDETE
ncbi:MAG: DNA recombination protein RmuC [Arenimonas sp.]|nr:DNA recombination protein RmuC [Arenimonas sp.]MBP7917356.1 DNA recombination protein RmuC [Arenimonas sp.]